MHNGWTNPLIEMQLMIRQGSGVGHTLMVSTIKKLRDGWTNRQMHKPFYRDAWMHQKSQTRGFLSPLCAGKLYSEELLQVIAKLFNHALV